MLEKPLSLLAGCAVAVGGAFALSAPQTYAAFTSATTLEDNSVASGTVVVNLVDAAGAQLQTPIVNVSNALPSMSTKTFTVRVKNGGSLPAMVELHSSSLLNGSAASLDDVLVATIKSAGGSTLFTGKVSALSVVLSTLAAGETATLTLELSWPDLPAVDDNPYQDASLNFAFVANASQLVV